MGCTSMLAEKKKKINMKCIIFLQVNLILLSLNLLLATIAAIKCFAAPLAAYFKINGTFSSFSFIFLVMRNGVSHNQKIFMKITNILIFFSLGDVSQ